MNAALAAAADRNALDYTEDPIVSSDVRGSTASGIVDGLATMAMDGDLVKVVKPEPFRKLVEKSLRDTLKHYST